MTGKLQTIYIYLPEEAVDCWVPAGGAHVRDDVYRIIEHPPKDPVWEFTKGDLVHCRMQTVAEGTVSEEKLVAFKRAT